jgi:hypothetical protein
MLQELLLKKVLKSITKKFNFDSLEKRLKQSQKNLNKALKYIEVLEKDVGTLKANSHPPIFSKKDYKKILDRLSKLENKKGE